MNAHWFESERHIAALLLIACAAIFCVGGILYTGRAIWKWPSAQTIGYLRWERGFIILAVVVTALGLVLLEDLLHGAGDPGIARLALVTYLIGAAVVLVAETSFLNSRDWNYSQVVLYIVLAFVSQAAFGVALLRTGLVPAWAGWATIIWNLAWLVILPIASPHDIYYPVLHHTAPLIIGIALLTS